MNMVRRILICVSILLISANVLFLLRMLLWAYRFDEDFSGSCACCTQEGMARFYSRFWSMFFTSATFGFAGCLGLAATRPSGTVLKVDTGTLGAG